MIKRFVYLINVVGLFIVWEYLANLMNNIGIALDENLPVYEVLGSVFMSRIIFVLLIFIAILIIINIICF